MDHRDVPPVALLPVPAQDEFVALPGGTWRIWPDMVLRSAGFPVRLVTRLADPALAATADRLVSHKGTDERADYDRAFAEGIARVVTVVDETAAEPRFREAVVWQNRALLENSLDRAARPRRDSRARARESLVARYLQRYTTKNESIGFFGPVGWASFRASGPTVEMVPGTALLSRRTVYFESWAADAVGAALAARPEVALGAPPRLVPATLLGSDHVRMPVGAPEAVTPGDRELLRLCDGHLTVHEIAARCRPARAPHEVLERLLALRDRDIVALDLAGPIDAYPERLLRTRLQRVPDAAARTQALRDLDALTAARDAVAAAAGDAAALATAVTGLNDEFERVTGTASGRLHGRTYAGRAVFYEDTVRDVRVDFGPRLAADLGGPLSLMLDSGRWLAARISADCLARLDGYYERKAWRGPVPLASLLALATRDFYAESRMPPVATAGAAELQRRWAEILRIPRGVRRHHVEVEQITDAVADRFASGAPGWASGAVHSPDVMLAAPSADALNRGEYTAVLGELHAAFNTMESRAIVEQSPDPGRLMTLVEHVGAGRRVVPLAPRAWGAVTARTSPPTALLSPTFTYWAMGSDDVTNLPGGAIPVAALDVIRLDGELVVRSRTDGRLFPLIEVIGEYLSGAAVNAFRLLRPAAHSPRVTIGRLVVARETWRLPARRCAWAFQLDEQKRYLQMREWLRRYGLPDRVFCSVPIETKPTYVDFTSVTLTSILAATVRRMAKERPDADITLSEMLPDVTEAWLADADGEHYTSELRIVAIDGRR